MPYPGVPKSKTADMERCIVAMKQKKEIDNPYALCHSVVIKGAKKAIQKQSKK